MKHICSLFPQEQETSPCLNCNEIKTLQGKITDLGRELFNLLSPSQAELLGLAEDLNINPHIYTSYLMPTDEPQLTVDQCDAGWVAENILSEREAEQ